MLAKGKNVASSSAASALKRVRRPVVVRSAGFSSGRDLSSPPSVGNLSPAGNSPTTFLDPARTPNLTPSRLPATTLFSPQTSLGVAPTQLFGGGSSQVSFSPATSFTSFTGLMTPASSHTGSILADPALAIERTREFILPADIKKVTDLESLHSTGYMVAHLAQV